MREGVTFVNVFYLYISDVLFALPSFGH